MSEAKRDPYDVLRVPRDADARTIKAAYFALVREFPPETHPAEFQELRDAYEVLSDPERREQVDASREAFSELGAEESALLRAAHESFARGDVAGGVALLRRLVADRPDLLAAREQLGLAHLRAGAFADAVAVWGELVERAPQSARYHLHLGYARHGAQQRDAALQSFRRAVELGGGDDARVALADTLADAGDWKGAVRVLDEGIGAAGDAPPPPLVRKKVAILLLHGQARRAWKAFDALARTLAGHERERAAHAEELASLAAWLFARGKEPLANQLLRKLAVLDPGRKPDRVFPSKATVRTADLPPQSVDWLAGKVEQPRRSVEAESSRRWSALALVPGAVLCWWAVARAVDDAPWDGQAWTAVLCLLAATALVFGGSRFHAALTSALPRMTLSHPAYLLKVDYDRVHVFPLVNLHDVKIVRHSTNGVYTHTQVHLPFGTRTLHMRFRSTVAAENLANGLLARRRRMLELLANGLLETEPGIDLIPAALLAGGRLGGRRPRWPFLLGGAVLAAALGFGASVRVHARAVEAREWGEARSRGTPAALHAFLAGHPERAGRVRAALDTWISELAAAPDGGLAAGPGRARGQAIVGALAAGAPRDVVLQVRWAAEQPAAPAAGAGGAFACGLPPGARDGLAPALQAAFDRTLGEGVVRLVPDGLPTAVALEIAVSAGAARTYAAPALPPLRTAALDYTVTVRPPGAAPLEARGSAPVPAAVDLPPAQAPAPAAAEDPARPRRRGSRLVPMPAAPVDFLRLRALHPGLKLRPGPGGKVMIELPDDAPEPVVTLLGKAPRPAATASPEEACRALVAEQLAALHARLARELGLSAPRAGLVDPQEATP